MMSAPRYDPKRAKQVYWMALDEARQAGKREGGARRTAARALAAYKAQFGVKPRGHRPPGCGCGALSKCAVHRK